MSTRPVRLVFGVASILLAAGTAQAQTAPSCSFDPDTATLTVTVNGIAASINRTGPGQIRVGTTVCTGATVTTTDTILVNGGDLIDPVTVSGSFAPGLTAEGDGNSEIEIVHSLGGGEDTFRYNATDNPETLTLTAGGMDIGNDLDEDITTAGIELVRIYSLGGDDIV